MSMPPEDEEQEDDTSSEEASEAAAAALDMEALKQSFGQFRQEEANDEDVVSDDEAQRWKDAFGDVEVTEAAGDDDEGFEVVGTF